MRIIRSRQSIARFIVIAAALAWLFPNVFWIFAPVTALATVLFKVIWGLLKLALIAAVVIVALYAISDHRNENGEEPISWDHKEG